MDGLIDRHSEVCMPNDHFPWNLISVALFSVIVSNCDLDYFSSGQLQFNEIRERILRLGIEMATSAQRDRFVENPVDQVNIDQSSQE